MMEAWLEPRQEVPDSRHFTLEAAPFSYVKDWRNYILLNSTAGAREHSNLIHSQKKEFPEKGMVH